MVTQRGLDVLRAIVQDYVSSREPVGSKSLVDRHGFGVSAATIRNDMAALEEEELSAAPHTASGRIPTDKGYRVFVDHLAEIRQLSGTQRHGIERARFAQPCVLHAQRPGARHLLAPKAIQTKGVRQAQVRSRHRARGAVVEVHAGARRRDQLNAQLRQVGVREIDIQ